MSEKKGGISIFGVLQIVFLVLKLTHLIEWSWFWVLSPLWIYVLLITLIAIYYKYFW